MFKDWTSFFLVAMLFAPLAGAPLVLLLRSYLAKYLALGFSLLPLLLGVGLQVLYQMNPDPALLYEGEFLFSGAALWFSVPTLDIKFMLGMDGISTYMVLLTGLIFPIVVLYSWGKVKHHAKMYYLMLLLLQTGLLGFFLSLDMLLFYVFFELVLIPTSFFIGIWGNAKREQAAMKFFLYTLAGSLVMLVAIIYLGLNVADGLLTTDYFAIRDALARGDNPALSLGVQRWLFVAFALSFAIKLPLFPFHTWQPLTYAASSTTGSVILAALLSKMGAYGFIRFSLVFFPEVSMEFAPYISGLAVVSIIYGAYLAVVQTHIKKLIAYASLSHMGFIVLGIFSFTEEALSGALLQMLGHGVATAALFLLTGMLYERHQTMDIRGFQGLAKLAPRFTLFFMITVMAAVGLPGLSGFVGEFMILLGAFNSSVLGTSFAIVATAGMVIAAIYLLNMFRRMMFGAHDEQLQTRITDLKRLELAVVLPLIALMFTIGIYAKPFLKDINRGSDRMIQWVETQTQPVETLTEGEDQGDNIPAEVIRLEPADNLD